MRFRACLLGGAILVWTTALHSQSKSSTEFRPKIPKAWDDAEVASMEIPLAPPAPRVTHISESYYYAIPPVTIYKSYPLISADKPFAEYLDWLKQQMPEDAFDPANLKTKADWEKAGELVFSFSLGGYGDLPQSVLDDAARLGAAPFARVFIRKKGKLEMNVAGGPLGSVTACMFCHSQAAGGSQIDGLQPNRPGLYPSPGMLGATADQRRQSMLFWYGTPWFNPDPNVDGNLTGGAVEA